MEENVEDKPMVFTTIGPVGSGGIDCCDHEHPTRDEAQRCLVAHSNEMRKLGKVSRRQVVETESLDALFEELEML